jgi:hypothetical protein
MAISKYSKEFMYQGFAQFDNVANFFFKKDSEAYKKYGCYVTGTIRYSKEEREQIENNIQNNVTTFGTVHLDCLLFDKDDKYKLELRKNGFDCDDILKVSASNFNSENKFNDRNVREIPNVMEIPVDLESVKYENIFFGLINQRISRGEKLIEEEKYELIGILLAQNDKKIPSEILEDFNMKQDEIESNDRIWFYYFKTLKDEGELTDRDEMVFRGVKRKIHSKRIKSISNELDVKGNGINSDKVNQKVLNLLYLKVDSFKPTRLLQIEYPIYWDFKSFIHVYFRHVKELQIANNFEKKSSFQYKVEDVEQLIKSVLSKTNKPIKKHFDKNPEKKFTRHGSMAVYYNGDYYCFDISSKGRLITFYK